MSTPAALRRRRDYDGPALFSYGFRPFFLAAGLWAIVGILLWIPQYMGKLSVPTHLSPLDWHVHEMLYGYVAATIAGFLLTAIPNWTGRLPVNGWPLAGLAALWLAGRLALLISAQLGGLVAAIVDTAFLVTLAVVAGREIIAGENWRNLRVLVILVVLVLGNIVFHAEVLMTGNAAYGTRIAIAAVILMISLIGGRIVPSFTNNWLNRNNPGRLPVPFSQFDMVALVISAFALVAWIITPMHWLSGALLIVAGCLQAVRLARWAGDRTVADRLVLILHIGYAFVPLGFVMVGLAAFTARGAGDGGHPCLDRRRRRPDDGRGHDAGDPRAHRSASAGRTRHAGDLCFAARRRARSHRGGLHGLGRSARICGPLLDRGLHPVRPALRAAARDAQSRLERNTPLAHGGSIGLGFSWRAVPLHPKMTIAAITTSIVATSAAQAGQPPSVQAIAPTAAPKLPPR